MADEMYTVVLGDTLSEIAWKYNSTYNYGSNAMAAAQRLGALNDIENIDKLYIGQVLSLKNTKGKKIKKKKNNSLTPKISRMGIQSNSENTVFATWRFTRSHVKEYRCVWYYSTGDGIWFVGSDSTETRKQSTYNPPSNATSVKFNVKAISKTHKVTTTKKVKGKKKKTTKEVHYWTGKWSKSKIVQFSISQKPSKPSAPSLEMNKYKLTAKVENIDMGVNKPTKIEFYVVKNNSGKVFKQNKANVVQRTASYSWNVDAGGKYKVKCRAIREIYKNKKVIKTLYSDWSDFSSEVTTIPNAPKDITSLNATSTTEIKCVWSKVSNVTGYEVEYTANKAYFDTNSDKVSSKTIEVGTTAIISGLEDGDEYFFRVRAVNEQGKSGWTPIKSCKVGQKPAAPTTWSSSTTAIVGEKVILYWVHNTNDGSKATKADLELLVNGVDKSPKDFTYTPKDEGEETTYQYTIDTNAYSDGATVQWRVRTAGVTGVYGDWSVQRTIDIYAPPTLELHLTNTSDEDIESLESFPLYVKGIPGPQSQSPIGYHLTVVSTEDYETEDQIGNEKLVSANEEIYSKYFDIKTQLIAELSANNIDLENGKTYKVHCIVTMNSGLTAEAESEFTVDWVEEEYGPDAEIIYNEDTYSCSIRPYCFTTPDEYFPDEEIPATTADETTETPAEDSDNEEETVNEILVEGVTLSVYRRDYNGEFIEIATGLDNTSNIYVTDPHPALDYGRYRVVVTSNATGSVSYVDLPGYPISESSVIIQWNETWNNLITSEVNEGEIPDEPTWSGSMVILPYNIDVSDKNDIDVSLVKYVGRKRPVSYYGTQLGETASWKVEIPKDDEETLYALRRLAIWTGDVYVREPSGTGYWANISVSMSQTHCQLTIPVTLEITRVEGGV